MGLLNDLQEAGAHRLLRRLRSRIVSVRVPYHDSCVSVGHSLSGVTALAAAPTRFTAGDTMSDSTNDCGAIGWGIRLPI